MADELILLDVPTRLGFRVRVTAGRWDLVASIKHPVMRGREGDVQRVLEDPDEVRRSRTDESVFLFYRMERPGRWLCAVAKRENGGGFLITAYPTDAIKVGNRVWSR